MNDVPKQHAICWSCQYIMDVHQDRCPECGESRSVELTPAFSADYGRARDLLDGASLLIGPHDSSGPMGGLTVAGYVLDGGVNLRPLRVEANREEEAMALLGDHGIAMAGGGTIVDISESNCPMCGAVLAQNRTVGNLGVCVGCGTQFTWIDVRT